MGVNGNLEVDLESLMYKDYIYHDISLVVGKDKDIINIMAYIDDPNLFLKLRGLPILTRKLRSFTWMVIFAGFVRICSGCGIIILVMNCLQKLMQHFLGVI